MTASRVMPSRMSSATVGVMILPSRTMNRFAADASFALPSLVRTRAS